MGILLCDGFQPVDAGWNVSESVRSRLTVRLTRPLVAEMSDIGKTCDVSPELVAQDRTALFVLEGARTSCSCSCMSGEVLPPLWNWRCQHGGPKETSGPHVLDSPQGS